MALFCMGQMWTARGQLCGKRALPQKRDRKERALLDSKYTPSRGPTIIYVDQKHTESY